MFSLGLPYAVNNYGKPHGFGSVARAWLNGGPPLDYALMHDDIFQYFLPYGIMALAVGFILYYVYHSERAEQIKQ